jgi:pilus assembly protein CpaE
MSEYTFQVSIEVKESSLRNDLVNIISSVDGFCVHKPDGRAPVDLMIFELGSDPEKGFLLLQSLIAQSAAEEIFLTTHDADPNVLLKAMRSGVKEVFIQPLDVNEVKEALIRLKERKEKATSKKPAKMGRIIELLGSKGGVGTTTLAVNLAVSLAEREDVKSVALIDFNMVFGEVSLFLEMTPRHHWGEITENVSRLDTTYLMNILSKHSSGVYVLPPPTSLNGFKRPGPQVIRPLLRLMQTMFDVVIIDGGHWLDGTALEMIKMSDTVLLVCNLNLSCLSNVKRLMKSFQYLGFPSKENVRLVVSRYTNKSDVSLKDAEDGIENKVFWTIPNDYRTTLSAINHGKPLMQMASKSKVTKEVSELAASLVLER